MLPTSCLKCSYAISTAYLDLVAMAIRLALPYCLPNRRELEYVPR